MIESNVKEDEGEKEQDKKMAEKERKIKRGVF